jgi:type I restriction enzyme M protein
LPHGILFRDAEATMRRKMIEEDLVECVIGLGPNMFYNSPMEACLLITKTNKSKERQGKVLIINAVKEVRQEKNIAYLDKSHIEKIYKSYLNFKDEEGFTKVVTLEKILENKASLNIAQFVSNVDQKENVLSIDETLKEWNETSVRLYASMNELFEVLK